MFTAALFITAATPKQLRCPSTDEWIKMWRISAMDMFGYKREILSFSKKWMDLQNLLSEVSQTEE